MINPTQNETERRLQRAAAFLYAGLGVQLVTFLTVHPLAFMAFILVGSPLVFIGIALYLWSIVVYSERAGPSSPMEEK